jgi:hypothetical protein
MRQWSARQWIVAAGATVAMALVVAVPTAVLPNPWFGREVPVTWWSYPTLAASAVLGGLLAATYVDARPADRGTERRAWIGGFLTWFAVGCPVCNKIVLLALGYTGALTWFAPVQPVLAVGSVGLLGWALRGRLRGATRCPVATGLSPDRP